MVATQSAVIVEFGSGLSLALITMPLMWMIRGNLLTRSKKIARLWYAPSSCRLIGTSTWSCLATGVGEGLKLRMVRFDWTAIVCSRRSRSPMSFSSGSTFLSVSSRVSRSATSARNCGRRCAIAWLLRMSTWSASSLRCRWIISSFIGVTYR